MARQASMFPGQHDQGSDTAGWEQECGAKTAATILFRIQSEELEQISGLTTPYNSSFGVKRNLGIVDNWTFQAINDSLSAINS